MTQRILVLNAEGFMGRRVLGALLAGGWQNSIAVVKKRPPAPVSGIEYRVLDITAESAIAAALQGVDAVVNCVPAKTPEISASASALFAAAARGAKPLVIHVSTITVYGDATGLISESAPLRADQGPYSLARVQAEHAAAAYPHAVILRPGLVYGPESAAWSQRFADFLIARRLGDLGADGDGCCNLLHVGDLAAAVIACLQQPPKPGTIFNLGQPNPPTWNDYLMRFGRALNAVPVRRISHRYLQLESRLLAPPLKILELGLRAAHLAPRWLPPALPSSLLKLMRQEIRLHVRHAEEVLGMRWTPLDAGLEDTARWYRREVMPA